MRIKEGDGMEERKRKICALCGRYIVDRESPEELMRKGYIYYFHVHCAGELDRVLEKVMEYGKVFGLLSAKFTLK